MKYRGNPKETYLEVMYILKKEKKVIRCIDIANELGITKGAVVIHLRKIKEQGLVTQEPYSDIKFTKVGLEMAEKIYKRYKIIYNFLLTHLNIEPKTAKNDTRRIERVISDSTLEYMRNYQ